MLNSDFSILGWQRQTNSKVLMQKFLVTQDLNWTGPFSGAIYCRICCTYKTLPIVFFQITKYMFLGVILSCLWMFICQYYWTLSLLTMCVNLPSTMEPIMKKKSFNLFNIKTFFFYILRTKLLNILNKSDTFLSLMMHYIKHYPFVNL